MSPALATAALGAYIEQARERRLAVGAAFFQREAPRIARLCHRMAERFARDGRLLALGASPAARSDARHVAVEFVHPVIVGKRALPALALTAEGGALAAQLAPLVGREDIVVAFGPERGSSTGGSLAGGSSTGGSLAGGSPTQDALDLARQRGALTISCAGGEAQWSFHPPGEDASIDQELIETLYHVLWELVHVFFEHRGLLEGRKQRHVHDPGAASFLYPFLSEREQDLEAVIADVHASVLAKSVEAAELRAQTLAECAPTLVAAASALKSCFDAGGRLLALGNGGSATDAIDVVADLREPAGGSGSGGGGPARPALDLTEDTGILTAIANDIGVEAIFSRQVIAYGHHGDALLALSTSGGSANVIHALIEARRRGLLTIALVGYDGGRILAEGLADHLLIVRSQHIPRIQEAQASLYHVLCELVQRAAVPPARAA